MMSKYESNFLYRLFYLLVHCNHVAFIFFRNIKYFADRLFARVRTAFTKTAHGQCLYVFCFRPFYFRIVVLLVSLYSRHSLLRRPLHLSPLFPLGISSQLLTPEAL